MKPFLIDPKERRVETVNLPPSTPTSEVRVSDPASSEATLAAMLHPGSMHRLVAFRIEDQRYAVQLPVVVRVLRMVAVSPLPQAPSIVLGVINVHGQIIPVLDVLRRFGLSACKYGLSSTLLIARTNRRTLALPVNEVLGVQEVTSEIVTSPSALVPGVGLVVGIAAFPDGMLFIHDLDAFLSLDEEQQLSSALEEPPE